MWQHLCRNQIVLLSLTANMCLSVSNYNQLNMVITCHCLCCPGFRQLQREILSRYITDDVKFVHFLGDVKGKDQYYGMYRSAVTGNSVANYPRNL